MREDPNARLLVDPLPEEPFGVLQAWLDEARRRRLQPNPDAIALATIDPDGRPAVRMLLCRGVDAVRGSLVFYSDRRSRKGRELAARPRAAAVFHWDGLGRQVRVEGPVAPSPDAESDAYFAGRPREAQLAAWASEQSQPIATRAALDERLAAARRRFADGPVPRPAYWGGYRLWAERVELWVGRAGRLHDRASFVRPLVRDGTGFVAGPWSGSRLQP